jgi:hypothetical protein
MVPYAATWTTAAAVKREKMNWPHKRQDWRDRRVTNIKKTSSLEKKEKEKAMKISACQAKWNLERSQGQEQRSRQTEDQVAGTREFEGQQSGGDQEKALGCIDLNCFFR